LVRKFLALILLPAMLFGALTFDTDYEREVRLLRAFDIPASFLNDTYLQQTIKAQKKRYGNRRFFDNEDEAYLFIPMIREILADSTVPSEFLFLAMAESGFSPAAYSHKKASGVWQFMPKTGKLYGLKIDDYVDERRDLVKSTQAAVNYLERLYGRFGKWYLAALAYNCGEGRVAHAIKKAHTDDIAVLLDPKKKYLPRESRRYIRKIVALALLASDEDFLIHKEYAYLLNRANAYSIAKVEVARGERLSRVAGLLHMPTKTLRRLNPHLRYDFVPPYEKRYEIYIPYIKLAEFKRVYKPAPLDTFYVLHTVKRGENLSKIGRMYRVNYKLIQDFNQLKTTRLRIRQKLVIPVAKRMDIKDGKYTVKKGDSLAKIAKAFETTIASLKKLNHLDGDLIRVGDRLSIYD